MATLNRQEQQYQDDLAAAEAAVASGNRMGPRGMYYSDAVVEQMRVTAARQRENADIRERHQAEREATRQTERDRAQARHDAEIATVIASFRVRAQASFPGTAAQFEQQWPTMLAEWQREQARDQMDAVVARKRAELNSFL